METNRMRLGNWINPTFPMQIVSIFGDVVYADFKGNTGDVHEFENKFIKPIPISEEWLLKCGFKRNVDQDGFVRMDLKLWDSLFDKFITDQSVNFNKVFLNLGSKEIELNFIHEIQNIYLELERKELIIK